MPKRGEHIHKRKDGRWEARYKCGISVDGKTLYKSVYAKSHKSLLTKYAALLENCPEHFVIKAATMMSVGVYVDQYLEFLDKCSYELFAELCRKADYKISEAQIALRKESR